MVKKNTKQKSKETKLKNDTKAESKRIIRKPSKTNLGTNKKSIVLKRSSGRKEKFDTDRLAQTMGRSSVSFPVARDVAKSVTKKIKKSVQDKPIDSAKKIKRASSRTRQKSELNLNKKERTVMVTADQIKNIVDALEIHVR